MLRQFAPALCLVWLGLAGPLTAQGVAGQGVSGQGVSGQGVAGVVVELFTSQGCSSCPPADAYLEELAQEPGVIALALHVDYWDYLGWNDKFGSAKFTDRQKAYARAIGSNTIYTPQMIVAGTDRVEGSDPQRVSGDIRRHQMAEPQVVLHLKRSEGTVIINAMPRTALSGPVIVQVVRYIPMAKVAIEHGENAGHTIAYSNIVTSWTRVDEWPGVDDLDMSVPVQGSDPVVVILQQQGPGLILAASVLK